MKAVVAAFNQEKALVGAFSVITNLRMQLFEALVGSQSWKLDGAQNLWHQRELLLPAEGGEHHVHGELAHVAHADAGEDKAAAAQLLGQQRAVRLQLHFHCSLYINWVIIIIIE